MLERETLLRELGDLRSRARSAREQPAPPSPLTTSWLRCIGAPMMEEKVVDGQITAPDATVKGTPIKLAVRYYPGTTKESALVFGGVHGDEDEGVVVMQSLRTMLDAAYSPMFGPGRRAACHVFLVENVRADRDALDPSSKSERWVEGVEPNRNFPLPGEGLAAAAARKQKGLPELVDPDTRRFPNRAPTGDHASSTILAENRLLMQLIACIKPRRALSAHSHGVSGAPKKGEDRGRRGDDPGVFIDPRGGFDTALDAPLSPEGRDDDALADRLLQAAKAALAKSKLAKADRAAALRGNRPGDTRADGETVHYAFSAPKARGTSFGMWAPAPIRDQGNEDRPGIQTITLEMPKWLGPKPDAKTTARVRELADVWAAVVMQHFLGVR